MRLFAVRHPAPSVDRREVPRTLVDCPARLSMPSGVRTGTLVNISAMGARMDLAGAPAAGVTVLLQWRGHEAFGRIAWSNAGGCGITFDRALSAETMQDMTGEVAAPAGPVARHGNIPLGRKRSLQS